MPTLLTLSTLIVAFLSTLFVTPYWIRRAKNAGLKGKDKHKLKEVQVAEVGGLPVVSGFLLAILFYIATRVFAYNQTDGLLVLVLGALLSVMIATIIGVVDDILGWKIGLRIRYKITLTFFIALPIMVINAGTSTMNFPLIGLVELGLFYPLIIVPMGIMGASNAFNMLAGYNGLEAGQGIIILSTLGLIAFMTGSGFVAVLAFSMVFSLLAFYIYNRYPARIFPGDTLTYCVGALIAIVAILGNIEMFAVILFIPYYIEFLLKARGRMRKESFAKLDKTGSLSRPYPKYYGLEHIAIDVIKLVKKNVRERDVVYLLFFLQLLVAGGTIVYFVL